MHVVKAGFDGFPSLCNVTLPHTRLAVGARPSLALYWDVWLRDFMSTVGCTVVAPPLPCSEAISPSHTLSTDPRSGSVVLSYDFESTICQNFFFIV